MANKNNIPVRSILSTGLLAIMAICNCHFAVSQVSTNKVSTFMEANPLPRVSKLKNGVWLKGDLHVHSRHSKESTQNPIAKILTFSQAIGMDYLSITDHDKHVNGDVANHTWADPEFKSKSILLLYGAEWTTTRGHGNAFCR